MTGLLNFFLVYKTLVRVLISGGKVFDSRKHG